MTEQMIEYLAMSVSQYEIAHCIARYYNHIDTATSFTSSTAHRQPFTCDPLPIRSILGGHLEHFVWSFDSNKTRRNKYVVG